MTNRIVHSLVYSAGHPNAAIQEWNVRAFINRSRDDINLAFSRSQITNSRLDSFPEHFVIARVLWDHIRERKRLALCFWC